MLHIRGDGVGTRLIEIKRNREELWPFNFKGNRLTKHVRVEVNRGATGAGGGGVWGWDKGVWEGVRGEEQGMT